MDIVESFITLGIWVGNMMQNETVDIAQLNQALNKDYIHYEPTRTDYSVNSMELELIEQTGSSIWKDVFLASLGIAIPSFVNGISGFCTLPQNEKVSVPIFMNFLFGSVGLILAVISLVVWQTNKKNFAAIIKRIKEKPKFEVPHK